MNDPTPGVGPLYSQVVFNFRLVYHTREEKTERTIWKEMYKKYRADCQKGGVGVASGQRFGSALKPSAHCDHHGVIRILKVLSVAEVGSPGPCTVAQGCQRIVEEMWCY
jgi:hypothetical protein